MRIWLLLGLLAVGCAATRQSLTILHTNDIHGHFAAERATWREDSALVGGFSALSGALDSVRAVDKSTIFLDAGDLMTGNPICNIEVDGVAGGALLRMLELCGCDAIAVGNHEFDLGGEHVRKFVRSGGADWLCGNVRFKADSTLLCATNKVIVRNGLRIGVVGLLLTDLAGVVSKTAISPFVVQDIFEAAQPLIDELDPATDLIILLTHNGIENDKLLARSVKGCDVIIGGHSHTQLQDPLLENGVIIAQAGSNLKQLGVLKLDVQSDKVAAFDGSLIELEAARFAPDSSVAAYCSIFEKEMARVYGEVIANAGADIGRNRTTSSPLGNLLCDLLRKDFGTDFAVVNSGGIRKDLAKGPIKKLDILEMLPFTNSVTLFTATGSELVTFAKRQIEAQQSGYNEILQMSGLEIRYSLNNQFDSLLVTVGGNPVVSDYVYHGVSIDYVLRSQADKYLGFEPRGLEDTGMLFSDFVIHALAQTSLSVIPNTEIRLIQTDP